MKAWLQMRILWRALCKEFHSTPTSEASSLRSQNGKRHGRVEGYPWEVNCTEFGGQRWKSWVRGLAWDSQRSHLRGQPRGAKKPQPREAGGIEEEVSDEPEESPSPTLRDLQASGPQQWRCCGLNVCFPLKFTCWSPIPQCDGVSRWGPWEVIRSRRWSLYEWG